MDTNKNNKLWKKKAISLSMAVTMTISGGSVLTGCSLQSYQDKAKEQEQQDNTSYHGTSSTPFIFNSGTSAGSSSNFTSSGWKSWTTPSPSSSNGASIHSSSYSGVHAASASS